MKKNKSKKTISKTGLSSAVAKAKKHQNLVVVNDLNDLAVFITTLEGKKEQVNIAQVKEILSVMVHCVRVYPLKTFEILCQAAMK